MSKEKIVISHKTIDASLRYVSLINTIHEWQLQQYQPFSGF